MQQRIAHLCCSNFIQGSDLVVMCSMMSSIGIWVCISAGYSVICVNLEM